MSSTINISAHGIKNVYVCNEADAGSSILVFFECESSEVADRITRKTVPFILSMQNFFLDSRHPPGVQFCRGFRAKPNVLLFPVVEDLAVLIAGLVYKKGVPPKAVPVLSVLSKKLER